MSEIEAGSGQEQLKNTTKIAYILYLVSLVFGVTSIIGVVIAYINKGEAKGYLESHYQFLIRTFWIGFLYIFIGTLTAILIIGWFILLFTAIWLVVRCIKGLKALDANQPIDNPTSWMF
ncbi:hypothetical protein G3R49_14190 [Shewanella sp. WXL01]|uniref:DUF4870 domain-containing protein n=1 Tax=Shewanella maritima TaxID=2520507 RepID=A0A411PL34_9GAMM|nr:MULTISPECIES: hypothetical protein [Shewanella]NKF51712.1 hypothetical protein [Shewanella sp. WXL01]QBF84224.1 hypothetical protein EXU30_17255 [Shewanella maritima]